MEKHTFISVDNTMLTLPVTPARYNLQFGMQKTIVHLFGAGDYVMPGRKTASSMALEVLLPAQRYPFCNRHWQKPKKIIDWLEKQVEGRNRVQYVITGANFSGFYYIQNVAYGEQDGTGDIYAKITLQQAPSIAAAETAATPGYDAIVPVVEEAEPDPPADPPVVPKPAKTPYDNAKKWYVRNGENFWTVCSQAYQKADLAEALAAFNGMDVTDRLPRGATIWVPDAKYLE